MAELNTGTHKSSFHIVQIVTEFSKQTNKKNPPKNKFAFLSTTVMLILGDGCIDMMGWDLMMALDISYVLY